MNLLFKRNLQHPVRINLIQQFIGEGGVRRTAIGFTLNCNLLLNCGIHDNYTAEYSQTCIYNYFSI